MSKTKFILVLSLSLLMLSGCAPSYDDGYDDGYKDGYEEAENRAYEERYDEGYDEGYASAKWEFYDSRFADGYRQGYADRDAGIDYSAAPRGDEYVWFSFVGDDIIYHKYTLPLPSCATAQSVEGFADSIDQKSKYRS